MSGLPRPDIPPGPARTLNDALHDLHHRAGWPSLRALATQTGVSHTTVSKTFSRPALPTWGTLELLVEAMHGDTATFHALWLAASTPTNGTGPVAPRIAGRRAELDAVRHHLDSGHGLLLVTGEAGIGKTKVVTTAARASDAFVATGHCLPLSSQVPLMPVGQALRSIHAVDDGRWLLDALTTCARYVPGALGVLLPELDTAGDVVGTGEDGWARQRLFTAIGEALRALSSSRPLALLLEDLHWADDVTLDLVEHLVTTGTCPALAGTWRLDEPATGDHKVDWWTRVRRHASTSTVILTPLSREETAEQLAMLAATPPSAAVVDRVYRRSQGQPLFSEQLAAQIDEAQELPQLLGDLLDQRIDGLQGDARAVACALAVADRPLTYAQLREVLGLAAEPMADALRTLTRRRLLDGQANDVGLRHPLLAEALRRNLVLVESIEAHRAMAEAMAHWPGSSAAEVAAHWQAAGDEDRELEWRINAARESQHRFALAQEADQWLRVIALFGDDGAAPRFGVSLLHAYCSAIEALDGSGAGDRAAVLVEEAAARLTDLEGLDRARLLALLGATRGYTDSAEGLRVMELAMAAYEGLPATTEHVDLLFQVSGHLHHQGRRNDTRPVLARAAAVSAQGGFIDRQRRALMVQAWDEAMFGDLRQAWDLADQAGGLEPDGPDPLGDIQLAILLTDMLLKTNAGADAVAGAAERGVRAADRWSIDTWNTATLRANVIEAYLDEGRVSRAAEMILPLTVQQLTPDRLWLYLERAHLELLSGDLAAAASRFAEVEEVPLSSLLNRGEVIYRASECLLWRGDAVTALDGLTHLLDRSLPTELSRFQGSLLARAARAAADGGRHELLSRLLDLRSCALVDPFEPDRTPFDGHAFGLVWTAEIARLAGAETLDVWAPAIEEWDRITRPHDAAYCRWRAAQCALRDGQGTVAARLLKRAAADAREHVPLSRAIAGTGAG